MSVYHLIIFLVERVSAEFVHVDQMVFNYVGKPLPEPSDQKEMSLFSVFPYIIDISINVVECMCVNMCV